MKTRVISGACFVAIITGFLLLRQVDYRLFAILIWFISAMGAFEMARAVKPFTSNLNFIWSVVLGGLLTPAFCIGAYVGNITIGGYLAIAVIFVALIGNAVIAFIKDLDTKGFVYTVIASVYPSVLFFAMLLTNSIGRYLGLVAILLGFVVSALTDTFAYLVGSKLQGPKLCPKLSPKKTWSGAIGGLLGGIIGALLVYFIFGKSLAGRHTWYAYVLIGLLASVFTQVGDLLESAIKRSVGIKDMGKIMPGHGGVLDRFDGIMFSVAIIGMLFTVL